MAVNISIYLVIGIVDSVQKREHEIVDLIVKDEAKDVLRKIVLENAYHDYQVVDIFVDVVTVL